MFFSIKAQIKNFFQTGRQSLRRLFPQLLFGIVTIIAFLPAQTAVAGESATVSVRALVFAGKDKLYGLDSKHQQLVQFDRSTGKPVRTISLDNNLFGKQQIEYFAATKSGFLVGSARHVWATDTSGVPVFRIAKAGSRPGQLDRPSSIVRSKNNRIYIAETGADRVSVFGGNGVYFFSIGGRDNSTNQPAGQPAIKLDKPYRVFVDKAERIYIVDRPGKHRINIFDFEGKLLHRFNIEQAGYLQGRDHKFLNLVFDNGGRLFFVDNESRSVIQYDWRSRKRSTHIFQQPDESTAQSGVQPEAQPEALSETRSNPGAIAVDSSGDLNGELVILPAGKSQVQFQAIEPQDTAGAGTEVAWLDNVVSSVRPTQKCSFALNSHRQNVICLNKKTSKVIRYSATNKPQVEYGGQFRKPDHLAINNDRIAIIDDRRLKVFTLAGRLISPKAEPAQFAKPSAIGFVNDKIIIADAKTKKLRIFSNEGADLNAAFEVKLKGKILVPDLIAADSSGNLLLSRHKNGAPVVYDAAAGRAYKLQDASIKTVHGLAVDGDDQWYVLATDLDKTMRVHIYHGLSHRFQFAIKERVVPAGISVTTNKGAIISLYDRKGLQMIEYRYQQRPTKVVGLRINGEPNQVRLRWIRSMDGYVDHYIVFASDSADGPLKRIGNFETNHGIIYLDKFRYQRFSVRAVSHSGLEGPASEVIENLFEPGFQKFNTSKFEQAADQFFLAEKEQPDNPVLLEYLGRSLLKQGKNEFALKIFQKMASYTGNRISGNIWQARTFYQSGRFADANNVLATPLVKSAKGLLKQDRLQLCGMVSLELNEWSSSSKCLRAYLKQLPGDAEMRAYLAVALIRQRLKKQASAHTSQLLRHAQINKEISSLLILANFYQETGDYKRAGYWFSRASEIVKTDIRVLTGLVFNLTKQKKFTAARKISLQMIAKDSQQAMGYQLLGMIALEQKKPGEAVLSLRKSVAKEPENIRSLEQLANAYLVLGNRTQARQAFADILRLNSGHAQTLFQVARIETKNGNNESAVNYLSAAIRSFPDYVPAHELISKIYENTGEFYLASIHALEADNYRPAYVRTKRVADLYYQQGRLAPALVYYKKLLASKRNQARLHFRIGSIYQQLGNAVLARKMLEKAVRLGRKNSEAYILLAHVYRESGMTKSAIRAAKSALAVQQSAETSLLLKVLNREQKNRRSGKRNNQVISIQKVELKSLYSGSLKPDMAISLGKIQVVNKGTKVVKDLRVRWFVEGLTRTAVHIDVPVIKARSTHVVPLRLIVNNEALRFKEDSRVSLELELEYSFGKKQQSLAKELSLFVHGEHGFDRSSPESASRFIARDLLTIKTMVDRNIIDGERDKLSGETMLHKAARLFALMRTKEIRVQQGGDGLPSLDHSNYLQYPVETLRQGKAGAGDISILLATIFGAGGINSALLTTSDDTLLLMAAETQWSNRSVLGIADSQMVKFDAKAWLPLDATLLSQGFSDAWKGGVAKFGTLRAGGYQIAHLMAKADKASLASTPSSAWLLSTNKRKLGWYTKSDRQQLEGHKQSDQHKDAVDVSISLVASARQYRISGLPMRSIEVLDQALQSNIFNYKAYQELGDIYYDLKNYYRSVDFYNKAIRLKPYDARAYAESAKALKKLNQPIESGQMQDRVTVLTH